MGHLVFERKSCVLCASVCVCVCVCKCVCVCVCVCYVRVYCEGRSGYTHRQEVK